MQKSLSLSKLTPYPIYIVGIFLIIIQILNIFPFMFTPIGWGKTIVFRIIFSVMLFLFACQILFKKIDLNLLIEKTKPVKNILTILVLIIIIYAISAVFSVDQQMSLWGEPSRAGGFINFALYIIFGIFLFFVIKEKDWQKIIDLTVLLGIIVSIVAVFQQFGIFGKYLVPFSFRPISTIGNAIILSTYLVLMSFLPISLGIKTDKLWRKIFYFFASALSIFVTIVFVQTRGAYIGLFFGALCFFFFYPKRIGKLKLKIATLLAIFLLSAFSFKIFMDKHVEYYQKIPPIISSALDRGLSVFEGTKIIESRISAWEISLKALKEKPIFGFGPENFRIAFDKYYDPSLPIIGPNSNGDAPTEWWDRAHNFIFDISITAGLPALLLYIALFFVLIYTLVKGIKNDKENAILYNGFLATFIAYLTTLFFSFDNFDTYLIFFILIGFLMFLSSNYKIQYQSFANQDKNEKYSGFFIKSLNKLYPFRIPISIILFIFLAYFVLVNNIKPLRINEKLNIANFYASENRCDKALEILNIIPDNSTIINSFVNQTYAHTVYDCQKSNIKPAITLAQKAVEVLIKNAKNQPNQLQNWIALSEYSEILIEEKNKLTDNSFVPNAEMLNLKSEAISYFQKAISLSPKRQLILKDWAKLGISTADYKLANEKADTCISLNENYTYCLWLKAIIEGYLGNTAEFDRLSIIAKQGGIQTESAESLQMIANMYIKTNNYKDLISVYIKLIELSTEKTANNKTQKAQLYASLAVAYQKIGKTKEARESALKILEIEPSAKPLVDEFLKTLSQ